MDKNLNELRNEIDKIDSDILDLLEKRIDIVRLIGQYKKEHKLEIGAPVRELEILNDILDNRQPKYAKYLKDIFRQIFTICKDIQKDIRDE